MKRKLTKKIIEQWKVIYDRAEEIDALSDKGGADWESLWVGWAIANGFTPENAFDAYIELIDLGLS